MQLQRPRLSTARRFARASATMAGFGGRLAQRKASETYPRQAVRERGRKRASPYDAIVVGGGPAGLSAAIYLARFNRSVLVIDAGAGRSTSHETNENYLGFPRGIRSRDLRERGCAQATRFGAEIHEGRVTSIARNGATFGVLCGRRRFAARTVILATGVVDKFPFKTDVQRHVGRSLFWCITCDGWKTRGKRVLVVGNSDDAAGTALQFLNFTDSVTLLTNAARTSISPKYARRLERAGVPLVRAELRGVEGRGGIMRRVRIDDGGSIELDMMFSSQGSEPNVELAKVLRLKLDNGYIKVDAEQRTSVPRIYAAGDVTRVFAHQVVTAAHEGATAGITANHDLYETWQR